MTLTPNEEKQRRLAEKLQREFGPPVCGPLADDNVTEIMVNPDGTVWIDTYSSGLTDTGHVLTSIQVENVITTVAALLDTVVTPTRPVVDGELPFSGHRFAGILPPVSEAPTYVIRKHSRVIYTLEDYLAAAILTPWQATFLRSVLRERKNLLISGGAASGKTTLMNALLHELSLLLDTSERLIILEDTRELQCSVHNTLKLRTADVATLTFLVAKTMRLRPDRIMIGEVRGGEALALLKAWNTGHSGGLATIHANSASAALTRLDMLVQEAGVPPQPMLVRETVDYVVHIAKTPSGRKRRRHETEF
jgi:type IV secretion system protein TrbB